MRSRVGVFVASWAHPPLASQLVVSAISTAMSSDRNLTPKHRSLASTTIAVVMLFFAFAAHASSQQPRLEKCKNPPIPESLSVATIGNSSTDTLAFASPATGDRSLYFWVSLDDVRRISLPRRSAWAPVLATGGKYFAFSVGATGSTELWIARTDGLNAVKLTSSLFCYDKPLAVSPDGNTVLFSRRKWKGGLAEFLSYWILRRTGTSIKLSEIENGPALSSDGANVYFENDLGRIVSVDVQSDKTQSIVEGSRPLPAPDGKSLLFARGNNVVRIQLQCKSDAVLGTGQRYAFDRNGSSACIVSIGQKSEVWSVDFATKARVRMPLPPGPTSIATANAFDGWYVLVDSNNQNEAGIWKVPLGKEPPTNLKIGWRRDCATRRRGILSDN